MNGSATTEIVRGSSPSRTARGYFNPLRSAATLWKHRSLISQFTRREVSGRYRGSFLGLFWSLADPLFRLLVYTVVFGSILQVGTPRMEGGRLADFALFMFCGMIVFDIFSDCTGRAPRLVVNNPNYVKKVIFPLEILPVSVLGGSLFHGLASLSVLIVANYLLTGQVHRTLLLLPLAAAPLLLLSLGAGWLLAALGVFFRDMQHLVSLVLMALFFGSGIFYDAGSLDGATGAILRLNPLAFIVDQARRTVLWGSPPEWGPLAAWTLACAAFMFAAFVFFMSAKKGFADVL